VETIRGTPKADKSEGGYPPEAKGENKSQSLATREEKKISASKTRKRGRRLSLRSRYVGTVQGGIRKELRPQLGRRPKQAETEEPEKETLCLSQGSKEKIVEGKREISK